MYMGDMVMNELKYDKMIKVLRDINTYLFINTILLLILSASSIMIIIGLLSLSK